MKRANEGAAEPSDTEPGTDEARLEALLAQVDSPAAITENAPGPSLRIARVIHREQRAARIRFRGSKHEISAEIAAEVDPELVGRAARNGDSALVECEAGHAPVIVGILQTRIPRELVLDADKIRIEGREEVTLVSGRAAMRLRADGDLEMVATRISAASRGFFKLVGRMLRLN